MNRISAALVALATLSVPLLVVLGDPPPVGSTPQRSSASNAASLSALSVGPTETVTEQAQDVEYAGLPAEVVVGWGGQVTAVWYRPDADVGFRSGQLFASVREVGGVWSEPLALSPPFAFPGGDRFDVAAGQGEAVSVVWTARVAGAMHVFEVHRTGPGWSSAHELGRGNTPRVAMDGRGDTTVMWSRRAPHVVTRMQNGVWSTPRVFTGGAGHPHALAGNRAGDDVLLWTQSGRGNSARMRAAFRARTSATWPHAVTVPSKRVDYVGAGLAVDRAGRVLAAWATGGGGGDVWWTRRSLAGRWSPARKVVGDVGHIGEYGWLDLSVNRRGRALIRWIAEDYVSYVVRYRPGHGVGKPVRLSRHRWPWFVAEGSPLMTATGTAVVAGRQGDGRVAYRWQSPGHPWGSVQRLDAAQAVNSVGARGHRMVILFQNQGIRAAVITAE